MSCPTLSPTPITKYGTSVLDDIPEDISTPIVELPHTWYLDNRYRIHAEQATSLDTENIGIGLQRQSQFIVCITTYIIVNYGSLLNENLYTIVLHHNYAPCIDIDNNISKTSIDKEISHFLYTIQYILSCPLETLALYLNESKEDLLGLVYWRYSISW
jgi:hypothetical protein